jgi:glycosyltransferase involved in cell wall biosynthesis
LLDPLKITQIVAPGVVGGAESVVRGLAIGLLRRGHRSEVIGVVEPHEREHPFLASLTQAGVHVHELALHRRAYLKEARLVHRILKETRPHVLHSHGYRPDVLDAPLARWLGIPTVTTMHGSSLLGGKTVFHEWLQLKILGRFQGVIAVSRRLQIELQDAGVPADRVYCIPNGWVPAADPLPRSEARRALGLEPTGTVVGWVARLIRIKACDVFLRAFAACRGLPVRAVIVGEGTERESLGALCAELGLENQVTFFGAHDQASRLFPAFDVFVISSRSEGTPITLLEAMAAKVPVISTAVGGIPDVLGYDQALLVPPEDPAALGLAIRQTMEDPAAARRRADLAATRLEEEFSAERWLDGHEKLYRGIQAVGVPDYGD